MHARPTTLLALVLLSGCGGSDAGEAEASPAGEDTGGGEGMVQESPPDLGGGDNAAGSCASPAIEGTGARADVDRQHGELESAERDLAETLAGDDSTRCTTAARLRDRICELSEAICEIADRYADNTTIGSRCEDARGRCESARERVGSACP